MSKCSSKIGVERPDEGELKLKVELKSVDTRDVSLGRDDKLSEEAGGIPASVSGEAETKQVKSLSKPASGVAERGLGRKALKEEIGFLG